MQYFRNSIKVIITIIMGVINVKIKAYNRTAWAGNLSVSIFISVTLFRHLIVFIRFLPLLVCIFRVFPEQNIMLHLYYIYVYMCEYGRTIYFCLFSSLAGLYYI